MCLNYDTAKHHKHKNVCVVFSATLMVSPPPNLLLLTGLLTEREEYKN